MRLTLIIPTLRVGGAQRVLSLMANDWAAKGHVITLITLDTATADFYLLHRNVERVGLGLMVVSGHARTADRLRNMVRRLSRLRQTIRDSHPEAIISFGDRMNLLTLLASLRLEVPVIVAERTAPTYHAIGWFWSGLRRLLYPLASAVVVQTDEVRRCVQGWMRKGLVYTIPNPVERPTPERVEEAHTVPGYRLITMGRLTPKKGFDLLLRAFARCAKNHPQWSLVMLGDGEDRENLQALARHLWIDDRVCFPGTVRQPASLLRQGDLFVLSSQYEGFPNALLEAMACGLPVISSDCPSGPRAIIRHGIDGVLVPSNDVNALAAAMDRLMSDDVERQRLASRAVDVIERFSVEKVMAQWETVLQAVTRQGS